MGDAITNTKPAAPKTQSQNQTLVYKPKSIQKTSMPNSTTPTTLTSTSTSTNPPTKAPSLSNSTELLRTSVDISPSTSPTSSTPTVASAATTSSIPSFSTPSLVHGVIPLKDVLLPPSHFKQPCTYVNSPSPTGLSTTLQDYILAFSSNARKFSVSAPLLHPSPKAQTLMNGPASPPPAEFVNINSSEVESNSLLPTGSTYAEESQATTTPFQFAASSPPPTSQRSFATPSPKKTRSMSNPSPPKSTTTVYAGSTFWNSPCPAEIPLPLKRSGGSTPPRGASPERTESIAIPQSNRDADAYPDSPCSDSGSSLDKLTNDLRKMLNIPPVGAC